MYKEICFQTAEVFKKDDSLSHWIINLALIRNDLLYANEFAFNHFEREVEVENGRFINYLKIALSHYIAAMKFFAKYQNEPEIIGFIESLDTQTKEKYAGILSNVSPYESSFVKNQCEPLVGATMHYADNQEDINKYLASYQDGTIVIRGKKIRFVDFEFADDCANYLSFTHIHSGETEDFCQEIGNKFLELMSFVEEVVPFYLSQKTAVL